MKVKCGLIAMAGVVHSALPCRSIKKAKCWRCLLEKKGANKGHFAVRRLMDTAA